LALQVQDRTILNLFSSSPKILRAWNSCVADLAARISAGRWRPRTDADKRAAMLAIERVDCVGRFLGFLALPIIV
jgi:hypothetical protein